MTALDDFVSTAVDEVGYQESGDNETKYGVWYGNDGQPWCVMFISWCADQAGILTTNSTKGCPYVPKQSAVPNMYSWYTTNRRNLAPNMNSTSNNRLRVGDVVVIDPNGGSSKSHAGIVVEVNYNTGTAKVMEGNCGDKVKKITYTNLYSSSNAHIAYLCSNNVSY